MDLKPLFPEWSELNEIVPKGSSVDDLVLTLPVETPAQIKDQALIDLKFAFLFLSEKAGGSEATYKAYRSAIERFLLFMWFQKELAVPSLHRRDLIAFVTFCQKPDPKWTGFHAVRYIDGRPNPEWRPFTLKPEKGKTNDEIKEAYEATEKTILSLVSRLSSFFKYLSIDEYIEVNPVSQLGRKGQYILPVAPEERKKRVVKRLSNLQMEYCLTTADLMAIEIPEMHERTRFIMHFMLSLYLRISEIVPNVHHTPSMKDFSRDSDGNWWFEVVGGKGNKDRLIPMSSDDVAALRRYRLSRDLHPYPLYGEKEPLIHKVKGKGQITSDRSIRMIIQTCFNRAKYALARDGFQEDADTLYQATVHWLRHTGISEDLNANGRPLAHVREDAGHTDITTTSIYINSDMRDRHNSKNNKSR